jgi:hypothetical protein
MGVCCTAMLVLQCIMCFPDVHAQHTHNTANLVGLLNVAVVGGVCGSSKAWACCRIVSLCAQAWKHAVRICHCRKPAAYVSCEFVWHDCGRSVACVLQHCVCVVYCL